MDTDKEKNHTLVQTTKNIALEVLKAEPTLQLQGDGTHCYEVAPIPGDRLSSAELQRCSAAVTLMEELMAIIGRKYYDVIAAAEQALYQYCFARVRNIIPDAVLSDVTDILSSMVRVDPPVHYYLKQL